jgi:hypothetical protein
VTIYDVGRGTRETEKPHFSFSFTRAPRFSDVSTIDQMPSYNITRRGARFLIFAIVLCLVLPALFYYHRDVVRVYFSTDDDPLPPLYEKYRDREQHLEHYKEYEQRKDVKYIWHDNHQHSA